MNDGNEYLRKWQIQKKNEAQDFTYTFPDMPIFFRVQRIVNRVLILLEGFLGTVSILGLAVCYIACEYFEKDWIFLGVVAGLAMSMMTLCVIARVIQGLAWRCPYCGGRFPLYGAGRGRYLKRGETLQQMEGMGIAYDQPRFCSLILPELCPYCRKKFCKMRKD